MGYPCYALDLTQSFVEKALLCTNLCAQPHENPSSLSCPNAEGLVGNTPVRDGHSNVAAPTFACILNRPPGVFFPCNTGGRVEGPPQLNPNDASPYRTNDASPYRPP